MKNTNKLTAVEYGMIAGLVCIVIVAVLIGCLPKMHQVSEKTFSCENTFVVTYEKSGNEAARLTIFSLNNALRSKMDNFATQQEDKYHKGKFFVNMTTDLCLNRFIFKNVSNGY